MNPHVDIVLLHDFRQDKVELFPADLIIPFLQIIFCFSLLAGCS